MARAVAIWNANKIDPKADQVPTPPLPELRILLRDVKGFVDRANEFVEDESAVETYTSGTWKAGGK